MTSGDLRRRRSQDGDLNLTWAELAAFENRDLLDSAIRAVCRELDCDYLEGLHALESWRGAARSEYGGQQGADPPVWAIVQASPIALDRFRRDFDELRAEPERTSRVISLDKTLPPEPEGEVDEEGGFVRLSKDADLAQLLADPVELERGFQAARELEEYTGPDGREQFERDWRMHVEGGRDLIGTLQLQRRERELAHKRARAERARDARERHLARARQRGRRGR